jgi:hypothetical protein
MLRTWRKERSLESLDRFVRKKRMELLFGAGGIYDSEQLNVRGAMLQQLDSSVQLMHHDLETPPAGNFSSARRMEED